MKDQQSLLSNYVDIVNTRYKTGISREHSYRGDLQNLLSALNTDVLVTNEPARVACGAPDYILTNKDIPVGYIEAKDIGKPLDSKDYKEQFNRYKTSLPNLIITDYLDFWLDKDGEFTTSIKVAEIKGERIVPLPDKFEQFISLYKDFSTSEGQTITNASKLAKMMAGKARLMADVITNAVTSDVEHHNNTSLQGQMQAFKEVLIHDITPQQFADLYAQTVAYGMFAARLHDTTLNTFSRQEAAELIPKSNPFLRQLFQHVAGYDLDDRIKWIVDALADVFRATDVAAILQNFGKATQQNDPIIHFYETFLAEYDPALRKSRGVWYTPEPVVNFIVRAVDDILKTEFNLPAGLADTSKTKITVKVPTNDKRSKTGFTESEKEVHKVQILDPACGTGTFLAEVVKYIYNNNFEGQQGVWSQYVDKHLIPRLNGFELLMASYAMAHLKLDLLLRETGYKAPNNQQRLRVYLTNSLEEHHQDTGTLFANWLSTEANEANHIKRDTPVMVVIGNPPYSIASNNLSDKQKELISPYRYINGIKVKEKGALQLEKNLNEDCIKFIALAEKYINENTEGILAFINTNNFLDAPTLRGMRWNLMQSFDKIYIIDLHGSTKKKEIAPDGYKDENVFDIQQGVSINLFIKKSNSPKCEIFNYDLYGKREHKYRTLFANSLSDFKFNKILPRLPEFVFKNRDYVLLNYYEQGISTIELFKLDSTGIATARDKFTIDMKRDVLKKRIVDFSQCNEEEARKLFELGKDSTTWKVKEALKDVRSTKISEELFVEYDYRPFDARWTYYTGNVIGFFTNPRKPVMQHMFKKQNFALSVCRQFKTGTEYKHVFISTRITDTCFVSNRTSESTSILPLYLYPETSNQQTIAGQAERTPNLNSKIVKEIGKKLGLTFTPEKESTKGTFAPIDILDYIYAVLHSPAYRETYKEFLKIDFPRVPYPTNAATFWQLVELGGQMRQIHLLESPTVNKSITTYPEAGSDEITRSIGSKDFEITDKANQLGRVWINETQYFDKVPVTAWEFYIGSYPPAQKWLKDRKDRQLSFEDIMHYQKIIVALTETDRLMKEIDPIVKSVFLDVKE